MSVSNVQPSAGQQTAKVMCDIAVKTDTTKKFIKVIISIAEVILGGLSFIPGAEGAKAGLSLLKGRLGDAKSVMNAAGILERPAEWIGNKELREGKPWQKTAGRAALTAAQSMETIGFVDKLSVGFFSQASLCIGSVLPIFDMIKNSLFAISAAFGLAQASKQLKESDQKGSAINAKLGSIESKKITDITAAQKTKYKAYGSDNIKKIKAYKTELYQSQLADDKANRTKYWVTIATEIAKIVMITLGMSVVLLSLAFPVLTLPTACLVMSSLGLVANAIGLSKNIYVALMPEATNKETLRNQHFAATTA